MPWIDSLDWNSLNSLRRYPLREGTSALSDNELFTIPDTLITDFSLSATSDVAARFYISRITNNITSVIIQISDQFDTVVGVIEAQETFNDISTDQPVSVADEDVDYHMTASPLYAGASGKITIGTFKDLKNQPAGIFSFSLAASEFEPRTIIPSVKGIDRIIFNSSLGLTGSVKLSARTNMRFVYNGGRVLLDAGDGLGLNAPCDSQTAIKTINGVAPDPLTGNINLIGLDCLNVTNPQRYSLELSDTCCTPCSGCDGLQELTSKLIYLEDSIIAMKNNYSNISSQLNMYLATVNSNCACPT